MKRNDLLTGEPFIPSRITQKFSCAQNRVKYHNIKANNLRHSVMFIHSPLQKNLRVLNEIMEGKSKGNFHKQFLLGKGFSFEVLTHYDEFDGKRIPCVYHYCIRSGESDLIVVNRLNNNKA